MLRAMIQHHHFQQHDRLANLQLIADNPLATLVYTTEQGVAADHLPLYYVEENQQGYLRGHVHAANPLYQQINYTESLLIIFQGPSTYISPGWYATKQEHGKVVPTWNYAVVHVAGSIAFINDPEWKLAVINHLTNIHEADRPDPWQVSDAPDTFIQKLLAAIIGIEIRVDQITGNWKMSQNQPKPNRQGVITGLSASAKPQDQQVVALMKTKIDKET